MMFEPNAIGWQFTYGHITDIIEIMKITALKFEPIPSFSFIVRREYASASWEDVVRGNYFNPTLQDADVSNSTLEIPS